MATETKPRTPGGKRPPSQPANAQPATAQSGQAQSGQAQSGQAQQPKRQRPKAPQEKGQQATGQQATGQQVKVQPGRSGTARPVSSPRHTRPMTGGVRSGTLGSPASTAPGRPQEPVPEFSRGAQQAERAQQTQRARQAQRMPFILLLVGLLGGALVSLLVISTTLDEGAYRINSLTQQNNALSKYEQILNQEVNQDRNEATIYQRAYQLGMRTDKNNRFINVQSGTISVSQAVTP
jgi:hypothetical protein